MRHWILVIIFLLLADHALAIVVDQDSVWHGEMSFSEDVRVLPGVTLTISPGARLFFSGGALEVTGSIEAINVEFNGDKWAGLLLKGNDSKTKLIGCVIKNAKTGVLVKGGTPRLEKLQLIGNNIGIELRGKAGGSVTSSMFVNNGKVGLFAKDDSTTAIADCRFEQNGRYGAYLYRARPGSFTANSFFENPVGLIIAYHGSDPVVSENIFEDNDIAIQIDRAARPEIKGNLLSGNGTGVYAFRRSDPFLFGNRIEKNEIGVLVAYSSYPRIEGNDFKENGLAVKLEFQSSEWEARRGADTRAGETAARTVFGGQKMRSVTEADRQASNLNGIVSAIGNWWGEAGTAELEKTGATGNPSFIHDGRDQATFVDAGEEYPLDRVKFQPWSQTALTKRDQ